MYIKLPKRGGGGATTKTDTSSDYPLIRHYYLHLDNGINRNSKYTNEERKSNNKIC